MSKDAATGLGKIVYRIYNRLTGGAERAANTLGNETSAASEDESLDADSREQAELFGGASRASTDSASDAFKSRVSKGLYPSGADRLAADGARKVASYAETARTAGPKFWTMAKAGWAALAVAAAAVTASIAGYVGGAPRDPPPPPPPPPPISVQIDIPPPLPPEIWDSPVDLATVEEGFTLAASQFDGGMLLDRLRIERMDLDTSDLPPPIVFAAAARAAVSVTENNSTQTVETSVGQLYQDWPEAQAQIEDAVTQNRGANIRVDITVRSEVADISIRG